VLGHRVRMGLGVFGIAGSCALLAIFWSPVWMITVALWFGAAAFAVLGFRTLLGRVGQTELRDPPWPAPLDPFSNPLVLPGQSMPAAPGQTAGPSPVPAANRSWASGNLPPTIPPRRPASDSGCSVSARPPGPDGPSNAELTDAVVASGKRIVRTMRAVVLLLSLLVLVPVTLLVTLVSVFQFRDGQVVNGLVALGAAVFTGGFAGSMIRRRKSLSLPIGE
jgi:hypothetical protein